MEITFLRPYDAVSAAGRGVKVGCQALIYGARGAGLAGFLAVSLAMEPERGYTYLNGYVRREVFGSGLCIITVVDTVLATATATAVTMAVG